MSDIPRNNSGIPDMVLATISSEKYKPWLIVQPGLWDGKQMQSVSFTCYVWDVDGSKLQSTVRYSARKSSNCNRTHFYDFLGERGATNK